MERGFCLREALHNMLEKEDNIAVQALVLLGCHLCKKDLLKQAMELLVSKADSTSDGISKFAVILLWPFSLALNPSSERIMRAKEAVLFEALCSDNLGESMSRDETIKKIESFIETVLEVNSQRVLDFVHCLSLSQYCRMIGTMYDVGDYPMLFQLAMAFWFDRTEFSGGGGRINIHFRDGENTHFIFTIGVSLNEGLTETAAVSATNGLFKKFASEELLKELNIDFNDPNRISDAYYFEMLFYRKVCSLLDVDPIQIAEEGSMEIIYLLFESNKKDLCKVYELLKASDDLDWILAEEILDKWTE